MVEIIKIDSKKPDKKIIKKAAEIIINGGTVVYPTDTLYGLAVNALDNKAVKKVFKIKGRERKPISIAVNSLEQAKKYARFNRLAIKLAKKFLPGPLTLILPSKFNLPKELNPNDEKVRIRIPNNRVALELIKKSGVPLTATSANLSGGRDPDTAREAIKQIGNRVDLVLDAGKCEYGKASTMVEVKDNKIKIIREEAIPTKKFGSFIRYFS